MKHDTTDVKKLLAHILPDVKILDFRPFLFKDLICQWMARLVVNNAITIVAQLVNDVQHLFVIH